MATNNAANLPKLTADGQLLIGNSAGVPSSATLTAGSNATITNGAGSITIEASGGGGVVLQQVRATNTAVTTGTASIPFDDTIPQNTEGTEIMTLSITPTSATSILLVEVNMLLDNDLSGTMALFRDTTANAKAAVPIYYQDTLSFSFMHADTILRFWETSGSTSTTTYKVRVGTAYVNSDGTNRVYGGVAGTTMTITEYSS